MQALLGLIFHFLGGTMWFLQFFFYGMGESKQGNGASSWILHMSFIILVANSWGVVTGEWKGVSKKAKNTIIAGIAVIVLSIMLVGQFIKVAPNHFPCRNSCNNAQVNHPNEKGHQVVVDGMMKYF